MLRAARRFYNERKKEILQNATNQHTWWLTLKESVLGAESSIPPLLRPGGGVASVPADKAELFSTHFADKQSRDQIVLPSTCDPEPRLRSFAFRSSEVLKLLLDLDPYGGCDPLGFYPLFLQKIARILAPKLSVVLRFLIRHGEFPGCWRSADVTPVPKEPLSCFFTEYRPISITPAMSKVFERLVAVRLQRYLEAFAHLPSCQFAYRKQLGTCDALLTICQMGQKALEDGSELCLVQVDFFLLLPSIM